MALRDRGRRSCRLSTSAVVVAPLALSSIGLGPIAETVVRFARWSALVVIMLLALAVLYRYGPSRRIAKWVWLSVGAAIATLSWIIGSAVLSYLPREFCRLWRHLWVAGHGNRHHGLDVDVSHRHSVRDCKHPTCTAVAQAAWSVGGLLINWQIDASPDQPRSKDEASLKRISNFITSNGIRV